MFVDAVDTEISTNDAMKLQNIGIICISARAVAIVLPFLMSHDQNAIKQRERTFP